MAALYRRATEGGSYVVRASLCQTGQWLTALGADLDPSAAIGFGDLAPWLIESHTASGALQHLGPVAQLSRTPGRWDRPSPPLGADTPAWLDTAEARR